MWRDEYNASASTDALERMETLTPSACIRSGARMSAPLSYVTLLLTHLVVPPSDAATATLGLWVIESHMTHAELGRPKTAENDTSRWEF